MADTLSTIKNAFRMPAGALEAGANLVSGALAEPVAGWAGILSGNADKVQATREALTYQPRTQTGQQAVQGIGDMIGKLKDAAMASPVGNVVNGYNALADKAGEASPALGAAAKTLPAAVAMLFGPGGAATRQAVGSVARGTAQGAGRVAAAAAENAAAVPAVRGPLARQDGIFAGHLSKTADLDQLEFAKALQAQGVPDQEIYAKTGWFAGMPDKQWRYEIPDDQAFIKSSQTKSPSEIIQTFGESLGGVMRHPELFEAYPHLKYTGVQGENLQGRGAFSPADNAIMLRNDLRGNEMKSTALHEVQHAVQEMEGTAKGGNVESANDYIFNQSRALRARLHFLENDPDVMAANTKLDDIFNKTLDGKLTNEQAAQLEQAVANEHPGLTEYRSVMGKLRSLPANPVEGYRRLAGEAEARLVQRRLNMTPQERAASYPLDMLDVPADRQIVRLK